MPNYKRRLTICPNTLCESLLKYVCSFLFSLPSLPTYEKKKKIKYEYLLNQMFMLKLSFYLQFTIPSKSIHTHFVALQSQISITSFWNFIATPTPSSTKMWSEKRNYTWNLSTNKNPKKGVLCLCSVPTKTKSCANRSPLPNEVNLGNIGEKVEIYSSGAKRTTLSW